MNKQQERNNFFKCVAFLLGCALGKHIEHVSCGMMLIYSKERMTEDERKQFNLNLGIPKHWREDEFVYDAVVDYDNWLLIQKWAQTHREVWEAKCAG